MQLLLLHKTIFPQHLQCIDTMKKFFCFIYLTCLMLPTSAQGILSLDSCRALAVANNKELLISREKINAAHYRKKEAFTNYLPKISATGGYMRNQKEFSLLNDAQKGALGSVGTQVSGALQNGIQGMMTQYPQLAQNPQFMALVIIGQYRHCHPAQRIGTIARRCFPHRHTQYVCRSADADPTSLYGR